MDLDQYRKEIDQLDNQLLEILNKRMEVVRKVGELKRVTKTAIYRPEREKSIVDRLCRLNKGPLNRQAIEAIYYEIFAISRNLELPELVAYLGPENSFTHQAAESRFGAMSDYLPLDTIKSVFESVETGRARFGVIPLENNQEGIVTETIDLLSMYDLNIVAEVPLSIHFALGSIEESINEIRKVFSRDIAFRQCRKFISETFLDRDVELIPVDSTSKAVKMAKREPGAAAICSHIAATKFNLPILFHNIEDSEDNFTRFLIIAKDMVNQAGGHDKTTILARASDKPGSLVTFLQDFYHAGINLTKIESRPAKKGKTFKYWFYIDFEGHFMDPNVVPVLDKHKKDIKLLGSYVKLC
ncbi:MAG: prephenate dehydratase [Cyclobacteriaceae bacterium]|nr:prephenate dehydratase [Cyclobacteriaceae bacterium]